ncbi:hypothetical protein B484DRAFT_425402 [Ochromonadaceae sp. CCMP2298]|nr:hypothetical protein B484DRAFT_425402 [Ochromonadaceae sp. CCMP2298]
MRTAVTACRPFLGRATTEAAEAVEAVEAGTAVGATLFEAKYRAVGADLYQYSAQLGVRSPAERRRLDIYPAFEIVRMIDIRVYNRLNPRTAFRLEQVDRETPLTECLWELAWQLRVDQEQVGVFNHLRGS